MEAIDEIKKIRPPVTIADGRSVLSCLVYYLSFNISFAFQCFQEIVIGVIQRNIDFVVVRDTSYAVHQQEMAVCSRFRTICW